MGKVRMIYFDQAAAMRPDAEVLDFHREALERCFANQEAGHALGRQLRRELADASAELAFALAGPGWKVVYAATGTDLFNLFAGLVRWRSGNLVASRLEHPALRASLRRTGAELRDLPVSRHGRFELDRLGEVCDAHTSLVALHHVQSEIGVRQELAPLLPQLRKLAPWAKVLLDSIQSAGKFPLACEVDFLTVSGHKLGAPGGAALLYREEAFAAPFEAFRQSEYRVGRMEPAAILTLAFAAKRWQEHREAWNCRVAGLNAFLRRELAMLPLAGGRKIRFTVPEEEASPYILHLLLPGYESAVLLRMLSEREIYLAAGSACRAESGEPSAALAALGMPARDGYSGLRLSFSPANTRAEAETFVRDLAELIRHY